MELKSDLHMQKEWESVAYNYIKNQDYLFLFSILFSILFSFPSSLIFNVVFRIFQLYLVTEPKEHTESYGFDTDTEGLTGHTYIYNKKNWQRERERKRLLNFPYTNAST